MTEFSSQKTENTSPPRADLSPKPAEPLRYAPLKKRFLAGLIDLVGVAILGLVTDTASSWFLDRVGTPTAITAEIISSLVFLVILWMTLYLIHTRNHGQTPGKKLMQICVRRVDTEEEPSKKQYALRAFFWPISFVAYAIGFWMVFFHPKKRALHDLVSGTWVVQCPHSPRMESTQTAPTQT